MAIVLVNVITVVSILFYLFVSPVSVLSARCEPSIKEKFSLLSLQLVAVALLWKSWQCHFVLNINYFANNIDKFQATSSKKVYTQETIQMQDVVNSELFS